MLSHNVAESRGTYFRVYNLGAALHELGHQVTVLATSADGRAHIRKRTSRGVAIIEHPALFPGALRSGWDPLDVISRWMKALTWSLGHVDIVHAFDCRPTVILPALRLVKTTGAHLVIDWADWWGRGGTIEDRPAGRRARILIRPIETFFEEHYRTRANYTTVISHALRDRAVALGVPEGTITLLPSGGDSRAITPKPQTQARAELGLLQSGPILGYLGSSLNSDAKLLASVFADLRTRNPSLRLLLIGDIAGNVPHIEGMIRTGPIEFTQLPAYLASCDLFVLPLTDTIANRGRWPGKINLYMAAGRPTVATPVGEVKRVFEELGGGILARLENDQFVLEVESLLAHPDRMDQIGRAARRLAVERFDWRILATQLQGLYTDVMGHF